MRTKQEIKNTIKDLNILIKEDFQILKSYDKKYTLANVKEYFYNSETNEEQLLAMIYLRQKFIEILKEIEK